MRQLEFLEPNLICKVKDIDGNIYEKWLFRFDDRAQLQQYLKEQTYTLVSVDDFDFQTWKTRADDAAKLANDAKNKPGFSYDNDLWTELKQYLFFLSKGKCGYCEQNVTGVYAGDVEHYRPKKKVIDDPGHPGYYWLAYDVGNYVPVCPKCNGARAKANHFPLDPNSPRAVSPGDDVSLEKPLLVNPIGLDDPTTHFEFVGPEGGDAHGQVKGITEAGKKSTVIYHLNRPELIRARRIAYKKMTVNKLLLEADWRGVSRQLIDDYKLGIDEFTLVIKAVLSSWFVEIREKRQKRAADAIKALQEQIDLEKQRQQDLESDIANDLLMLKSRP